MARQAFVRSLGVDVCQRHQPVLRPQPERVLEDLELGASVGGVG